MAWNYSLLVLYMVNLHFLVLQNDKFLAAAMEFSSRYSIGSLKPLGTVIALDVSVLTIFIKFPGTTLFVTSIVFSTIPTGPTVRSLYFFFSSSSPSSSSRKPPYSGDVSKFYHSHIPHRIRCTLAWFESCVVHSSSSPSCSFHHCGVFSNY